MKIEFERVGSNYDFGPLPVIWNKKVWESLINQHLKPKNENLWDAIKRIPSEIRWYGESLLKFEAIPIHTIDPLFHVYHYFWQYKHLKNSKKSTNIGECKQSNWDLSLTTLYDNKSFLSKFWKKIKQRIY